MVATLEKNLQNCDEIVVGLQVIEPFISKDLGHEVLSFVGKMLFMAFQNFHSQFFQNSFLMVIFRSIHKNIDSVPLKLIFGIVFI